MKSFRPDNHVYLRLYISLCLYCTSLATCLLQSAICRQRVQPKWTENSPTLTQSLLLLSCCSPAAGDETKRNGKKECCNYSCTPAKIFQYTDELLFVTQASRTQTNIYLFIDVGRRWSWSLMQLVVCCPLQFYADFCPLVPTAIRIEGPDRNVSFD